MAGRAGAAVRPKHSGDSTGPNLLELLGVPGDEDQLSCPCSLRHRPQHGCDKASPGLRCTTMLALRLDLRTLVSVLSSTLPPPPLDVGSSRGPMAAASNPFAWHDLAYWLHRLSRSPT